MERPEEKRLITRIDVGPRIDNEVAGCILLYEINEKIEIVFTSRDNGDASLYLTPDEAKILADEINKILGASF